MSAIKYWKFYFQEIPKDNLNEYRDRWKGEDRDFPLNNEQHQDNTKVKGWRGYPQVTTVHNLKIAHCVALYSSSSSWEAGSEEESCLACAK